MSDKPAPAHPDSSTPEHAEAGPDGDRSPSAAAPDASADPCEAGPGKPREIGGRGGLDPVRYGDWEKNGRCIDF